MTEAVRCSLCSGNTVYYCNCHGRDYYRCSSCHSVLMSEKDHLSPEKEKLRYDQHNNDLTDPGYRNFIRPLVDLVKDSYPPGSCGLDYGAGPGPLAAAMLEEEGYEVKLFDPFYWNDREALRLNYDYIICSEVIEHFRKPGEQFSQLRLLLKPTGSLFCMTELYSEAMDFCSWHYATDPTHLFFYHRQALQWIKVYFGFQSLFIEGRLIRLKL